MTPLLKLDGTDIFEHVRVSKDEGFDPLDNDFLEPQFSESAIGSGNRLISVHEGNREMMIPVHMKAADPKARITNLVKDPEVTDFTNAWDGIVGSAVIAVTTEAYNTAWGWKTGSSGQVVFTHDGSATNIDFALSMRTGVKMDAEGGERYSAAAMVNVQNNTVDPVGFGMHILWFDAAMVSLGQATSTGFTGTGGNAFTITNALAPANTRYATMRFYGFSAGPADVISFSVGGVSFTNTATPVAPFCGSDPGCEWTGTPNASTSLSSVGRVNLMRSPNFEDGTVGEIVGSDSTDVTDIVTDIVESWSIRGRYAVHHYGINGGAVAGRNVGIQGATANPTGLTRNNGRYPCFPGQTYRCRVSAYVMNDSLTPLSIAGTFTNADGTTNTFITGPASPAGTGPRDTAHSVTVPAGATHLSWRIIIGTSAGDSAELMVDDIICTLDDDTNTFLGGNDINATWFSTPHLSVTVERAGKQGLHDMMGELESILAGLKTVEWRDDGAASTTYFNSQFGRFEPDYNYRRSQKLWASGVIHVWVEPFGHTGTYRSAGTGAASGLTLVVPLASIGGDVAGDVRAYIGPATSSLSWGANKEGRIVGVAAIPTGYVPDWAAASMGGNLLGASGYAGSQVLADNGARILGQVILTAATPYAGRNRLLLVAQGDSSGTAAFTHVYGAAYDAYDGQGGRLGGGIASGRIGEGLSVVDLGVLTVDPTVGRATTVVNIVRGGSYRDEVSRGLAPATAMRINRLLILPEADTAIIMDTNRQLLGNDWFTWDGTSRVVTSDRLGNAWVPHGAASAAFGIDVFGDFAAIPISSHANMTLAHRRVNDLTAEAFFAVQVASAAMLVGKSTDGWFGADLIHNRIWGRAHYGSVINASLAQMVMSLYYGAPSAITGLIGTLVASKAVTVERAFLSESWRLRLRQRDTNVELDLGRTADNTPSAVIISGTINGSFANAFQPGQTLIGMQNGSTGNSTILFGMRAWTAPSIAYSGSSRYRFESDGGRTFNETVASAVLRETTAKARGNSVTIDPARHAAVVGIHLPLDLDPGNESIGVDVRVREKFTYLR